MINEIKSSDSEILRTEAAEAQKLRKLTDRQLEIIYRNKWFKLFIPENSGGLGFSLPDAVSLEEKLAEIDGSLGWTVTLCAGASLFSGYFQPDFLKQICRNEKLCIAGSGKYDGIARQEADGYLVNGSWNYASGSAHASVFTANCVIYKDNQPVLNQDGTEKIRSFCFLSDEVKITPSWDGMGMQATSSNSFSVSNLRIPEERTFQINPEHAFLNDCIYKYPFKAFAEVTLAANFLGLGQHFLEEANLYYGQESQQPRDLHAGFSKEISEMRGRFYSVVKQSWQECQDKREIFCQEEISSISKSLARLVRKASSELYPYCGMQACFLSSPINKIWRDIHTVSQHFLLL